MDTRRRGFQAGEQNRDQDRPAGGEPSLHVAFAVFGWSTWDVHVLETRHGPYQCTLLLTHGLRMRCDWRVRGDRSVMGFARPTTGQVSLLMRIGLVILFLLLQGTPARDDGQWTMPGKNYAATRYSGLAQITTRNAPRLPPVWSLSTR